MYTLGSKFMPSASHAGGLRYHGMNPVLSQLYHDGYIEAISVEQSKVFEAAKLFAKVEGILPAPESSHAIKGAIDEALKCKKNNEEKTIVFGLQVQDILIWLHIKNLMTVKCMIIFQRKKKFLRL